MYLDNPLQYQTGRGGAKDAALYGTINDLLPEKKGWTNVQIAEFTGHPCDTIAWVLREGVAKALKAHQRIRAVAVYDAQLTEWLKWNRRKSRVSWQGAVVHISQCTEEDVRCCPHGPFPPE
jgi:hypothetical protein